MNHDHGSDGPGSGNNETLSHGLQINSIYWETGHRTYLPFWASLLKKFSPKIIDDKLRSLLGEAKPVSHEPFVFYGDSAYFRSYYGDPDVNVVFPLKKRTNFCFSPTGKSSLTELEHKYEKYGHVKENKSQLVFKEVLRSARELDKSKKKKDLSFITRPFKCKRPLRIGRFQTEEDYIPGDELEGPLFTDEELKNIQDYIKNIEEGVYGREERDEFERVREETNEEDIEDPKEILKETNPELEKKMNQVFDLSNLETEGKSVNMEELEKKLCEGEIKEEINVEELRSMVKSIYRKQGLLNEPFKVLEVEGIKINWRQSLNNAEIWFEVENETKKKDYEVIFMPSTVTIKKQGKIVLEKKLAGKVDVDGCFWTMYKSPSRGAKYVNINLTKRKPKFNNMWDELFS